MILGLVQARVSSSRLPGKVLKPLAGAPMLLRQMERVMQSKKIDICVVATSTESSDDPIEALCASKGIRCFRGSLDDVLDRMYQAALPFNADHIVRMTGDCPLIDPEIIDRVIEMHTRGGHDYTTNAKAPFTFPDGLDVEVLRRDAFESAWREATLPSQREHVTPFVSKNPERFKIGKYQNSENLGHLRWTVDEQEDYELVSKIYDALYFKNPNFTTGDVLQLLSERGELLQINSHIARNEGKKSSELADKEFVATSESAKPQITIGVTCVGGVYIYDMLRALRSADDFEARIIGMDGNAESSGRLISDVFEHVPMASEDEVRYASRLKELTLTHKIDVIIFGSEAETRAAVNHREMLSGLGVKTTADNPEAAKLVTDKGALLDFLKARGIDVGAYVNFSGLSELPNILRQLGYPDRRVVLKPRDGAGSRGVLIADAGAREFVPLLKDRFCGAGSQDVLLACLRERAESLENYLAMPHIGGNVYDVDCLAKNGDAIHVVPRLRQYKNPLSPVNEGCEVAMEKDLITYVSGIVHALNIHGACDFDVARDEEGNPRILDASCRMSGSVAASFAAGVNLPAQLVRILLDLPLAVYQVQNKTKIRPVNHLIKI